MPKDPVTEVCLVNLKAPYNLKDPSTPEGAIWDNSIAILKKCPGFRDIYTSSVVEDKKKARMFLNWDCKEDHFAFYDAPHFPAFREQLLSLCSIPPIPIHVLFTPAQPRTLVAPATEIVMGYFPLSITPQKQEEWENLWKSFAKNVQAEAKGLRDVHGGWVIEDMDVEGEAFDEGKARAWLGTLGWESVQAHLEFQKTEAFGRVVGEMQDVPGKLEVYHVELS